MKSVCIYLASPRVSKLSTGDLRIDMLCKSIENTSKIMKDLPYIIFHEDLIDDDFKRLRKIYSNITFEKLDFVRNELPFVNLGRPKGYMLMCRFFSGELQKHKALETYDSYIRFDDDSFLLEPFLNKNSLLQNLQENDYIFRTLFFDKPVHSLYDFTVDFIHKNGYDINKLTNNLKRNRFLDNNNMYTGLAPYNNFHACKLSLWREPLITKYIQEILDINGSLMKYWMDANIHSMIIFILMPLVNKKLSIKTDFGYRHNRHFSIMNSLHFAYNSDQDFYPK